MAASELEADATTLLVFALTALVIPLVWLFVFALITAASELEAVVIVLLVFPLMTAASELDAVEIALLSVLVSVVTSFAVARLPDERLAPVSVRVALLHTSATSVPNPESVREV